MRIKLDVEKLKKRIDKKQDTINRRSQKLKNAPKVIKVGWFKESGNYPEQGKKPVEYIARIHEEGLGNHTDKHMVSNTIFEHKSEWASLYKKLVRKGSRFGRTPDYYKISEQIGVQMKKDLRNYVFGIDLVDTTRLANSILVKYSRRLK